MCLFGKNKVTYNKCQSFSNGSGIAKDFFTLLDEERQNIKEKQSQAKNSTSSLGKDFYSIFNDTATVNQDKDVHRRFVDQHRKSIISAYNGENIRALSLQYHCSQKEIIQILKESIAKNDKNCLGHNIVEVVTDN